jgi:RND superfamily putative drug exporter
VSLIAVAALLLAAAFSWFDIRTGFSGITDAPEDLPARIAFEALLEEFPGGTTSPVLVVIDGDVASAPVAGAVDRLTAALEDDAAFGIPHYQANEAGDLGLVSVPLEAADSFGGEALDQVRRLRAEMIPAAFAGVEARVLVGGETAFGVDFFGVIDRYTPWVYAFVLGLSFVLLTVVFRSIVVPIEAIILNLLSVGAATGLVVLVFQKGFLVDALGFTRTEAIEAWLPLFLFSILFGLSMDYHVFLLTRIRERFDQTADNSESVAHGLRTTGAIITGAAVIMVAVFAGFAAGDLVALQQMGFGLAVAVFLDATLVRSVLVPATMKLLGDRNWYLPRFLRWLPDLKAEGQQPTELVHSQ